MPRSKLKYAFKTCSINNLPKSYQDKIRQRCRNKEDDHVKIIRIVDYYVYIWAEDLPVVIGQY